MAQSAVVTVAQGRAHEPGDELAPGLVLEERLGGGKRTDVFRARLSDGDVAVVKILRPALRADAHERMAFRREIDVAQRLDHDAVVRLRGFDDREDLAYSIWEHVPSPSLEEHLIAFGPLPIAAACAMGAILAEALGHLHERDVVHLDVATGNVTVGTVKLLDLGLARRGAGGVRISVPTGTGPYMSLEQCRAGVVDARSDVFGLGATLYESITGLAPFEWGEPESTGAARYPQLEAEAQPIDELVPACPPDVGATIHACLAHRAEQRPAAAALGRALREAARRLGVR